MKKILLILSFLTTFSFAVTDEQMTTVYKAGTWDKWYIVGGVKSSGREFYGNCTGMEGFRLIREVPHFEEIIHMGPRGTTSYCNYVENLYYAIEVPSDYTFAPTCTETDSTNSDCSCKSGYVDDGTGENCIYNCSALKPIADTVPKGWDSYVDVFSENQCIDRINSFPFKEGSFRVDTPDMSQPQCTFDICNVNEFTSDPCNLQPMSIPQGYIFRGTVSSENACASYVDFVNYYNYDVQLANPDCSSNQTIYCYLKATALNNDATIALPDTNNTNPDGSYDVGSLPELDSNNTTNVNNPYDGLGQTNSLMGQLSDDVKGLANIMTASDEYWKNDNNQKFAQRTANDNANANSIVSAVDGVGNKIDTTNDLLQQILDKDSNVTVVINNETNTTEEPSDENGTGGDCGFFADLVPDELEGVICGNESMDDFFNDKMFDDAWYEQNKITMDFTPNVPCYLETLSIDFGNGSVDIISEERMEIIPLDLISNIILSVVYLLGFSLFVRDK